MTSRKLTLLSLLASMLSIALPAAAAQGAATFSAPLESLEGERVGSDRFVVAGIEVDCDAVTYRGTVPIGSRSLALEPAFDKCIGKALTGLPADFYQELCDFVLRDLQPRAGGERWAARVDIECHGEWDDVGWDLFETEWGYSFGRTLCGLRIPEQDGVGTALLRNTAGDRAGIEVRWQLDDFEYEVFEPSLVCGAFAGTMQGDGLYEGRATVDGVEIVAGEG